MPKLVANVVEPGTLANADRPLLRIDGELELRPFRADDADAVVTAFRPRTSSIDGWHDMELYAHLSTDEA